MDATENWGIDEDYDFAIADFLMKEFVNYLNILIILSKALFAIDSNLAFRTEKC